jgi:hypothetical protein
MEERAKVLLPAGDGDSSDGGGDSDAQGIWLLLLFLWGLVCFSD